jgi:hypothetical protein
VQVNAFHVLLGLIREKEDPILEAFVHRDFINSYKDKANVQLVQVV